MGACHACQAEHASHGGVPPGPAGTYLVIRCAHPNAFHRSGLPLKIYFFPFPSNKKNSEKVTKCHPHL